MKLENQLSKVLSGGGEHAVADFLAKHPELVRWAVCKTSGHVTYVLKHFPFGSNFVSDFVVVMGQSFSWRVHLIELEPPGDMIITKKGLPSNRLSTAISQINDWKMYIEQNPIPFRSDLSNWCMKKDLLKETKLKSSPINGTGNLLSAPATHISLDYTIFIGKREVLDREKAVKFNQNKIHPLDIHTYGIFQDIARNLDISNANPLKSMRITETFGE